MNFKSRAVTWWTVSGNITTMVMVAQSKPNFPCLQAIKHYSFMIALLCFSSRTRRNWITAHICVIDSVELLMSFTSLSKEAHQVDHEHHQHSTRCSTTKAAPPSHTLKWIWNKWWKQTYKQQSNSLHITLNSTGSEIIVGKPRTNLSHWSFIMIFQPMQQFSDWEI